MHADLNTEQRELAALAREVMSGICPPAAVRACWEAGGEFDADRWRQLADSDLLGVMVPGSAGGLGLGAVEWTVVLEEAGRVALPEPIMEFAGLAPALLTALGESVDTRELLAGVANGRLRVAVQLEADHLVAHADTADAVLLLRPEGVRIADPATAAWERVCVSDHTRRIFAIASAEPEVTTVAVPGDVHAKMAALAAIGTAATLVGLSQFMIDRTVAYVSRRVQFGRPVGAFQAVQHRLADCHVKVEMCRPIVWQAAYLLDHDLRAAAIAASVAKAFAAEASAFVNDAALQLHGAIGFSWEDDLHLWLKRGHAFENLYGSAEEHRRRIADYLFAGAADEPRREQGHYARTEPR